MDFVKIRMEGSLISTFRTQVLEPDELVEYSSFLTMWPWEVTFLSFLPVKAHYLTPTLEWLWRTDERIREAQRTASSQWCVLKLFVLRLITPRMRCKWRWGSCTGFFSWRWVPQDSEKPAQNPGMAGGGSNWQVVTKEIEFVFWKAWKWWHLFYFAVCVCVHACVCV